MAMQTPDLTFLDHELDLWSKEMLDDIDKCLDCFKESISSDEKEDCFDEFCLRFAGAKNKFLNELKDLPLIMKCRYMADKDSKFGGEQCAKFMSDIQKICDNYLNTSIYSDDNSKTSLTFLIKKIRGLAEVNERKAWDFEYATRQHYQNTGKDNTLEIIKRAGYEV